MDKKTLTTIIASIFVIGIMAAGFTSADRIIDNATGIYIENFVAGSTVQANFSYDYLRDRPENPDNSPLILRINITSSDSAYPVWRGDFDINGFIKRYILFGLIPIGEKHFNCSEQDSQTIVHPLGNELVSAENGTFYCYNPEGDLDFGDFNAQDIVYLNITSHPALWPGQYNLEAKLFYLSDTYPPTVNILNKSYFDQYFSDGSHVSFEVEIIDVNLHDYNAKIIVPSYGNISFAKEHVSGDIYRFFQTLPTTDPIPEGEYLINVYSIDTAGNVGEDNTTLRIDRTPPEIELIEPKDKVYSGILPIEFNVTDEKSRVKNVTYRLKEMDENNNVCPTGKSSWECYDSGDIPLDYNFTTETFKDEINTIEVGLESGRYWIQAEACDNLGNCRKFDPANEK